MTKKTGGWDAFIQEAEAVGLLANGGPCHILDLNSGGHPAIRRGYLSLFVMLAAEYDEHRPLLNQYISQFQDAGKFTHWSRGWCGEWLREDMKVGHITLRQYCLKYEGMELPSQSEYGID